MYAFYTTELLESNCSCFCPAVGVQFYNQFSRCNCMVKRVLHKAALSLAYLHHDHGACCAGAVPRTWEVMYRCKRLLGKSHMKFESLVSESPAAAWKAILKICVGGKQCGIFASMYTDGVHAQSRRQCQDQLDQHDLQAASKMLESLCVERMDI